jgi:hypothetical protein
MIIERIAGTNRSFLRVAVPKVSGEDQGNLNEKESDLNGSTPKGNMEIKNDVREQVLKGLDTNGDGIVSQTESMANARKYNQAKALSQDEHAIRNEVREQVLKGLDANGDGIVSQTEAIANASEYSQAKALSQDVRKTENSDQKQTPEGPDLNGDNLSILA